MYALSLCDVFSPNERVRLVLGGEAGEHNRAISHATTALRGLDCIDTLLPELEGRSRKRSLVTLLPYGVRVRRHPTALRGWWGRYH